MNGNNNKKMQTTMANGEMKHDTNIIQRNKYNISKSENVFPVMNKGNVGYKKEGSINRTNHNNTNHKFINYGNKIFNNNSTSHMSSTTKFSRPTSKIMNNNEMNSYYSSKNINSSKGAEHQYKKKMFHSKMNEANSFSNLKKPINKDTNYIRSVGGMMKMNNNSTSSVNNNFGNSYRHNHMGYGNNNKASWTHSIGGTNTNYSLGLFIEDPKKTFVFDVEDLKQLFSHYNGAKHIRILSNKAAAQINFYDQNMIQQVKKDINGLTIDNVGTIRCIVLNDGKKIEQFLPFSSNDPYPSSATTSYPVNTANAINILNQITAILYKSQTNRQMRNGNVKKDCDMLMEDVMNTTRGNNNYINNSNNNNLYYAKNKHYNINSNIGAIESNEKGNLNVYNYRTSEYIANSNKTNKADIINDASYSITTANMLQNKKEMYEKPQASKRLSRIELIDIFGYPLEFDVQSKIQGADNANINYINEQTNNKLKFEIKGKADNNAPVVERIHLSISSDDFLAYQKGIELTLKLLNSVFQEYCDFCVKKGVPLPPALGFKRHEYVYNSDGTTKYMGVKEKGHITKDNCKTDSTYTNNEVMKTGDKVITSIDSYMFNTSPPDNLQNVESAFARNVENTEMIKGSYINEL